MRKVLTLQQFIFDWKLGLKVTWFSIDMWINEFIKIILIKSQHSNQSILTELIIPKKWFIKANPGVKDFAQAMDQTLYLPVHSQLS